MSGVDEIAAVSTAFGTTVDPPGGERHLDGRTA